ncbi:MAG: glycosyltransferase family 4 protein [Planctomycetes bacterium]|nr:glycosyltransferase family 4 protein [Planctomycetota bacterium]
MTAQKLKILMLNYEFPPIGGGAGKANLCLLNEFAGNETLEIDVLTSRPEPGLIVEKLADNITIYKVGVHKKNLHHWRKQEVIEWLFKGYFQYTKLLKNNDYDLAHAFFGFPTGLFCRLSAARLPYIISLRGSDVPGYNVRLSVDYKLLGGLFSSIWHKASAVIANSKGLSDLASEFTPDIPIGVIANGVCPVRFSPPECRTYSGPLNVLTVCRLTARKRVDMLIEAVSLALAGEVDVRLNIAGHGELFDELNAFAVELNVSDRVNFLGRVPPADMPAVYRDNDVFVMSSAHEGMSNAMLEAMASGLPVITTRCEGVEELIADNGIIVGESSPRLIADAIVRFYRDKEQLARMAHAAVNRAGEFTWKDVAERYLAEYKKVIAERKLADG